MRAAYVERISGYDRRSMTSRCKHYEPAPNCAAGHAEWWQLPAACDSCSHYEGPGRGIGDTVHGIARATGIAALVETIAGTSCGCGERRAILNRVMPFAGDRPDGG